MLCATIKNLFATATWRSEFVDRCAGLHMTPQLRKEHSIHDFSINK